VKRTAEFLVKKRDGRREWLRATKLTHSILLAFASVHPDKPDVDEPWRAMDVACSVLTGLRSLHGENAVLTTDSLAEAVPRVLLATGHANAADAYEKVGAEQQRRQRVLRAPAAAHRLSPSGPTGMFDRPPTGDFFSG
jgi:hypothetical protein